MNRYMFLAWMLPFAAGFAAYAALEPKRGAGWTAAALGYGSVFGLLFTAAATTLFARSDTAHAFAHAAPWLASVALVLFAGAWRRGHGSASPVWLPHSRPLEKWKGALLAAAMVSLAWRGWIALREILLRPTFPWDAWDAWAVKSKAWFLLGHYAPFVSMRDWLAQTPPESFTGPAWSYPATLGWIQVWFASASGGWVEPLVNLPWFVLWLGMLLAHYGQWRALGLTRIRALVFVYLLGSLPLLSVHVALAGYADLWIAALFGLAVLAWMRWLEQRECNQLGLALICAMSLPLLKLEGAVWLLLFACVAAFGALPQRWRRYVIAGVFALLILGMVIGKLVLPLFDLGWGGISGYALAVPVIGQLAVAWHGTALAGVLRSLFTQPNWHLLWWLTPLIVIWRWRELHTQPSLRLLGLLLLAGFSFLAFLFLFTDAARWAESYTAINRLVMHIVPTTLTLLALLCRNVDISNSAIADTTRASGPPADLG